MSCRPRRLRGLLTLAALLLAGLAVAWAAAPHEARGADEGRLRSTVHAGKARERALLSAAAHLARLERAGAREVAILDARLAEAQRQLAAARQRLAATQQRLAAERRRLARLRKRLAQSRALLEDVLRRRYMSTPPDIVSVVLDARGFADLLERMEFLR